MHLRPVPNMEVEKWDRINGPQGIPPIRCEITCQDMYNVSEVGIAL